jgi:putative transposase
MFYSVWEPTLLAKRKSAMQESAVPSSEPISSGRPTTSAKRIRITKSSRKSAVASTTIVPNFVPFWTESTAALSLKCALPVATDSAATDSSWSNSSLPSPIPNSWFTCKVQTRPQTKSSLKISSLLSTSLLPKTTDAKLQRKGKCVKLAAEKSRKIRLFPTPEQKLILNKWFSTARWTYNRTVASIREGCDRNKKSLRATCVNNDLWLTPELSWVKDTPYDIRDEAMNDVLKAYKTSIAAKRKKFVVSFKSRKATSDSIALLAKHYKTRGIFHPSFWTPMPLDASEPLPDKLEYDCRLQRTRLGKFYLCVPRPLQRKTIAPEYPSVIALDPGVRTFQTGYCPDGSTSSFGDRDIGRIANICRRVDKLQSKCDKADHHKQRYRMRQALQRMRDRIRNLVGDCHHKVAKQLCSNYTTVLLPLFETRNMVSRIKRRIGGKTARMMLTWSHYRFRQTLLNKAREYPWIEVIIVDESFTSKTCGRCGCLHNTLGSSKIFFCPQCEFTLDRDVNGARNILLKFLTEHKRAEAIRRWGLDPGASSDPPAELDFNVHCGQKCQA